MNNSNFLYNKCDADFLKYSFAYIINQQQQSF